MLKKLFKPVNSYATSINLVVILLMVIILLTHQKLPPKIPLWFSLEWGGQRLANPLFLWTIPLISSFFFVSSFIVSKTLYKNYTTISEILVWATTFLSFVFLLSIYKIILLVI